MKTIRCAIYTRKSSDEGLEQDFNSLDAQREACAAYVLSQASEGWKLLPERYDDGGISGGTLDRPALQRLLADVKAGRIDIIVIYKVDRLTRSLLDFARLVEAFDEAGTSFVSVTQSFNTTTSMGRLTLNMLLSFAQFEREVTAERIRDKIAASKAKGMWMGGTPPLGYRPDGRSLAIVEDHAAIVRDIYARYLALGNVRKLADALTRDQITTPRRTTGSGRAYGGCAFARGQLYFLLKNPIYVGDIPHKDKVYSGHHPPIIDRETWNAVQQRLADHVQGVRTTREQNASLLAGLLFDADGEPLIAVHTNKGKQRYRYYVSKAQHHRRGLSPSKGLRIPAGDIEQAVRRELGSLLSSPYDAIERLGLSVAPAMFDCVVKRCPAICAELEKSGSRIVRKLVSRVVVHPERLDFIFDQERLARLLGMAGAISGASTVCHHAPVRLTRTGNAVRRIHESGPVAADAGPNARLIELLVRARRWWCELAKGDVDIATLSRREAVNDSYLTRIVRLAFLSPEVVEAILAGKLPAGIDARVLIATDAIAADWSEQAGRFLLASQ